MNNSSTALYPDEGLYQRLAQQLQAALSAGRWPSGLPSERKLSDSLAVSRHAARKALDLLCQRGLLERRRGSGTYPVDAAWPVPERWLQRETGLADADELLSLGLSPGSAVTRLQWLRGDADGALLLESHCLSRTLLPYPEAMQSLDLDTHLAALDQAPVRRLQRLRACNATPEQARLLGLKPGDALLGTRTLSYGRHGQVLLLGERLQAGATPGLMLELEI